MAQIIIPKINPIKYVPKDLDITADSIKLDDRYNFDFLPASFEGQSKYSQKWIKGDPIRNQIWSRDVAIIKIEIRKCDGTLVTTINRSAASLLGYLVNGIAWDINQFDYDSNLLTADQEYYFVLRYGQTLGALTDYISERQQILGSMDESVLFKYSHSYNEYNCIFKTSYNSYFNQTFYFRVEGRVHDKNQEGIFTEFDDQKINRTLLSAKPFDSRKFVIGGKNGVPEWAGTTLNFIRSCDTVFADSYQVAFFDKWEKDDAKNYRQYLYSIRWAKSKTEYAKVIDVCEPVTTGTFTLPDTFVGAAYIYTLLLSGSVPFAIDVAGSTIPAWMKASILDNILYLQTDGTTFPSVEATGVTVSIKIDNACGTVTLADTIDVLAAITCVAAAFTGTNIFPSLTIGQSWNGFIGLTGTATFTVSSVTKPAWMTITPASNGIQLSGTPNLSGIFTLSFSIQNCAGPGAAINFNQNFGVLVNVTITGFNDPFSNTVTSQSGQILAIPGTLVTVEINANGTGSIPPNTYNLTVTLTGATPSVPLTVTNGILSGTFIMPSSGFVGWSGVWNATDALGVGYISVS